jgi:hypothetical protein
LPPNINSSNQPVIVKRPTPRRVVRNQSVNAVLVSISKDDASDSPPPLLPKMVAVCLKKKQATTLFLAVWRV